MQFRNYLDIIKSLEEKNAICIEENFSWIKGIKLPNIDLGLPTVEKRSKIIVIKDKINPIYIQLEDGSKLFFTYSEFKRIDGDPKVGKSMYLKMQRLGEDKSSLPSIITTCRVIEN